MPKFVIIPADSPDVQCEFEIPRTGKASIEFSIPRVEYCRDFEKNWTAWIAERMKKNEDGTPAEPMGDKEAIVEQIRIAGAPAAAVKALYTLTVGELNQIFTAWTEASKVSVGESAASAS